MHYKDTTTGECYGFKANSNCIEVTVEEIEAEREAAKTPEERQAEAIAHYKGLYLGVVDAKLEELDYDSLATVQIWVGNTTFVNGVDGKTYGDEATAILNWYQALISKNYELLNAGTPLTDEEYLAEINAVAF